MLAADGKAGVHDATPTAPVFALLQVVVTKLLPAPAADGVQLAIGTLADVTGAGHDVVT